MNMCSWIAVIDRLWVNIIITIVIRYSDVIINVMESQITGVSSVYSSICSGADQRKHQSFASLAFETGIHRWTVDSPRKRPATRKRFPFDDIIMIALSSSSSSSLSSSSSWSVCRLRLLSIRLAVSLSAKTRKNVWYGYGTLVKGIYFGFL